ncbi:MAG: hypothetical protein J6P30_04085 [Fibrobacter sp.]|nr:hypothetical protein [Fibrobacter sp.]
MRQAGFKSILVLFATLLCATGAIADDEESKPTRDLSRLSVFAQPSISFLSFDQRKYFQNAVDTIYAEFKSQAVDAEESLYVAKQNFQKVNFCFPVTAGLQYQVTDGHFLSAGIGFIYDNESVVLSDRKNKAHNYSYTIQGVPAFLEYRLAIPGNLITLSNGGLFSVAVRWYWTLPGTEIYTTWGKLEANNKPWGAGFGVSLGYLIASWNGLNVFGDIGFSTIKVESKETFADIVPDGPTEKAKWDIGGLQLQIRMSFGLIKMPAVKLEDAVAKGKDAKASNATAVADSTTAQKPAEKPVENATPSSEAAEKNAGDAAGNETAPATTAEPPAEKIQPKAE